MCDPTPCSCVETNCDSTQDRVCPDDGSECYCVDKVCEQGQELKWDPEQEPEFHCEAILCDSFQTLVCVEGNDPECAC